MPCEICGDRNINRNYTHSRNAYHKKLLFKKMQEKKIQSIAKYGIFIWEEVSNVKDKI